MRQCIQTDTANKFPEYWVIKALREIKTIIAIDGLDELMIKKTYKQFTIFEIKFVITTRPGISDDVVELFENQNTKCRVLNIKPIQEIKDKEKLVKGILKGSPNINPVHRLVSQASKQNQAMFS